MGKGKVKNEEVRDEETNGGQRRERRMVEVRKELRRNMRALG